MRLLTLKSAAARGYRELTTGYALPKERRLLERVMSDMDRGGIDYALVRCKGKVCVWRGKGGRR